jgi:hypothetical protein
MLLDEIIDLAVDSKQPVTALLRKCIVLAHQLKNERLRKWANEELNGYGDARSRILAVHSHSISTRPSRPVALCA